MSDGYFCSRGGSLRPPAIFDQQILKQYDCGTIYVKREGTETLPYNVSILYCAICLPLTRKAFYISVQSTPILLFILFLFIIFKNREDKNLLGFRLKIFTNLNRQFFFHINKPLAYILCGFVRRFILVEITV